MARQAQAEGLNFRQKEKSIDYANRLKLGAKLDVFLKTQFPQDLTVNPKSKIVPGSAGPFTDLALIRRVMRARWNASEAKKSKDRVPREQVLQEHARAFFPPTVRYTAL